MLGTWIYGGAGTRFLTELWRHAIISNTILICMWLLILSAGSSLVALWLGLDFMLWPRVQSLVGERRSYKLHGLAKKKGLVLIFKCLVLVLWFFFFLTWTFNDYALVSHYLFLDMKYIWSCNKISLGSFLEREPGDSSYERYTVVWHFVNPCSQTWWWRWRGVRRVQM